jgi:two-component system, sensor histidine kinase and response regulator
MLLGNSQDATTDHLRESLNLATQSARIAVWDKDLIGGKFVASPQFWEFYGFSQPVEQFRPMDGIHPDERATTLPPIFAVLNDPARNEILSLRHRTSNPKNPQQFVQSHIRVFRNAQGRAVKLLGVTWDVTQDVENQRRLQEQAEQLRLAQRRLERASLSSLEGHWEADIQSGRLWCSSSFHTLLGYAQGGLGDHVSTLDKLIHESDRSAYLAALQSHLNSNAAFDLQLRLRMSSGDHRWFYIRGMAERDEAHQPRLIAGSIHDVHQQRLAEDALQLAQERFERAINGTQDGLWEIDVITGKTWCSPRLAELLGYPVNELEGIHFLSDLVHPEDSIKVSQISQAHYDDNQPFDLELRIRTRSGNYRWYRARGAAERDSMGIAKRLSGSLRDVTEALSAREELVRATEAAEAANRAKGEFLANVSHEIRTPMNGIIGMSDLLLNTSLDRSQHEYAETIRSCADSLLAVINDILDFSKIEAGKLKIESIEMDLRSVVEEVIGILAFQAASKDLELIVNIDPELPERVMGDPQRLRQCLMNLVSNAIKFTQHGEIVVDIQTVGRHDGRVLTHIEVRDSGIGIKSEVLPTLFQPFNQADSSTTRYFGGTGLGLSIVRRLVELMGGQVGVVSEYGRGSTFFFTLSLEPIDIHTEQPSPFTKGRILVVASNEISRRVLSGQLEHVGHHVECVSDAASALTQLQQGNDPAFNIVIVDFRLTGMSGLELGKAITHDPALNAVRVIALTSLDNSDDVQRCRELGFAAYLTKPVRSRELLHCIAKTLDSASHPTLVDQERMITPAALMQNNKLPQLHAKVLLVEDHPVNQKVATRYLERLGCAVQVAENGVEGVAVFQREHFDVILMDVQMPVMDGLAATRKIRELELSQTIQRRIPIIALTANAMRGDQERCTAAGMDGFLTKPIDVERLREALINLGLQHRASKLATNGSETNPSNGVATNAVALDAATIDLDKLHSLTEGDHCFSNELFTTFFASGRQLQQQLQSAYVDNNRDALARAAHSLKGASATIFASRLAKLSATLERQAESLTQSSVAALISEIECELDQIKKLLNARFPHSADAKNTDQSSQRTNPSNTAAR